MLKTLLGVLIVLWMIGFGLRYGLHVFPLLLVVALIVVLIHLAVHRRAVH
jgi:hypothetical protein